jgi:hypothetical protein
MWLRSALRIADAQLSAPVAISDVWTVPSLRFTVVLPAGERLTVVIEG